MPSDREIEAATNKLNIRMGALFKNLGVHFTDEQFKTIVSKTVAYALEAAEQERQDTHTELVKALEEIRDNWKRCRINECATNYEYCAYESGRIAEAALKATKEG